MRAVTTLLLIMGVVASGCLAPPPGDDLEGATSPGPGPATGLVERMIHTSGGTMLPPSAAILDNLTWRIAATGHHRGEPTVGVTSDGTIFMPAGASVVGGSGRVIRSTDNGRSWTDVTDPLLGPKADLDPWVFVDAATDRVFHGPLYVACTWLSFSDDNGETWLANPVAGCGTPGHDHQKITAGPPAEGTRTNGYASVLYYAYNSFRGEGTVMLRSLDGGMTFGDERVIHPQDACMGGLNGPITVATDGTVYVPKQVCDTVHVLMSRDSGLTWDMLTVPGAATGNRFHSPMIATDSDLNAYLTYNGKDGQMYFARAAAAAAADSMTGFTEPVRVSPPGTTLAHMSVIAAGAPGRVAIAYLATDEPGAAGMAPNDAPATTRWHLMVSMTGNALDDAPTWVTVRATPEDDPVQIGRIWQGGGTEPKRNLRDFIGIDERDGRVYVAFADGCTGGCTTSEASVDNEVSLFILETGPSLGGAEWLRRLA